MSGQRISVVRADDLLVCQLELDGLEVVGAPPNRELGRASGASAARLIVHLPPQHVAEEAFDERLLHGTLLRALAQGDQAGVVDARAAGPSRVAFAVPETKLPVPYRLEAILELLTECSLSVAENATEPRDYSGFSGLLAALLFGLSPPQLAEPGPAETAIELPFRLILSPNEHAGFSHATEPAGSPTSERTELWHSRLALRPGAEGGEQDAAADQRLRAIWLREGDGADWSPTQPGLQVGSLSEPFRVNAIKQQDRASIVHLTSNRAFRRQTGADFDPSPVAARRLALSSLGAWLDARGEWDSPALIRLIEWSHRATLGRDHFVRIVEQGFTFPFCHLAATVTVTERRFVSRAPGEPAVLFQETFPLIRRPIQDYPPGAAPPGLWHTMPLRTIRLETLVAPAIEAPGEGGCFLIREPGAAEPFMFKFTGIDAEGNVLELSTPLVFVFSTHAWDDATLREAKRLYEEAPGHVLNAGGADLAIAPGPKRDTTFPTGQLEFTADLQPRSQPPLPPADKQPGFWPKLVMAKVRAPALDLLTGQAKEATISYHESYRAHGLGGDNRTELIAQLTDTLALDFTGKGDRAGGLMRPSVGVRGLSRRLGAVGGPADKLGQLAQGTFEPKDFFAGMDAKLFGIFKLEEVLARVTGAASEDMPRTVTERVGDVLRAKLVWAPVPQSFPPDAATFVAKRDVTTMQLAIEVDAKGPSPSAGIETWLKDFELHLVGGDRTFIELAFDKLEFRASAGKKPDVDVQLRAVRFVGDLAFVERLKEIIPLDGFSDPPALEIDARGIRSSFSLSLPDLAVGVFALQNVSLGAGFTIPFVSGPLTVQFNFCTREEPFLLTVSLFGGGGFFALAIDPRGVQRLEAALEFGACAAINLGVAQGGVQVMAGVYYKFETGTGATLSGYFRLSGNMSVLGLISASIELTLEFRYQDPGKAIGRATLTVEIDIFMFSMSVEVSCERCFAGSDNDPSFHELMQPHADPVTGASVRPWHQYCGAYA